MKLFLKKKLRRQKMSPIIRKIYLHVLEENEFRKIFHFFDPSGSKFRWSKGLCYCNVFAYFLLWHSMRHHYVSVATDTTISRSTRRWYGPMPDLSFISFQSLPFGVTSSWRKVVAAAVSLNRNERSRKIRDWRTVQTGVIFGPIS